MIKQITAWILAILVAFSSAIYQKVTGPTYPVKIDKTVDNLHLSGKLSRSGTTGEQTPITITIVDADSSVSAKLIYKKYRYNEQWNEIEMIRKGDNTFTASLPSMPPAAKLEYALIISRNDQQVFRQETATVIRYKGKVSPKVLVPHIIFIFLAMIISNLVIFLLLFTGKIEVKYIITTILFMLLGGFVFGPIVQKMAFGAYWTGFPFGYDLTDNKVLIGLIGWLLAYYKRNAPKAKWWVWGAYLLMLIVFLIPHSMLGSELNYETMEIIQR